VTQDVRTIAAIANAKTALMLRNFDTYQ
jgi:hypothetical protein